MKRSATTLAVLILIPTHFQFGLDGAVTTKSYVYINPSKDLSKHRSISVGLMDFGTFPTVQNDHLNIICYSFANIKDHVIDM